MGSGLTEPAEEEGPYEEAHYARGFLCARGGRYIECWEPIKSTFPFSLNGEKGTQDWGE
jgi:hypothetical protein